MIMDNFNQQPAATRAAYRPLFSHKLNNQTCIYGFATPIKQQALGVTEAFSNPQNFFMTV